MSFFIMMFYCLADEQEDTGGNAESQNRQKGNYQNACHGEPPLFVPIFTISLVFSQGKYNSAAVLSFVWERNPTQEHLFHRKYFGYPTYEKTIGYKLCHPSQIKSLPGFQQAFYQFQSIGYGLMIPFRIA
jgi:hypothetical protein